MTGSKGAQQWRQLAVISGPYQRHANVISAEAIEPIAPDDPEAEPYTFGAETEPNIEPNPPE